MRFNHIDASLTNKEVKAASLQFTKLITELAVRTNNEHIGSGLGGNNFQLLVLFGLNHSLHLNSKSNIYYQNNVLIWDADWLYQSKMKDIRAELDLVFPHIAESQKIMALALEALAKTPNLRSTLEDHKDQFKELMRCLNGQVYSFNSQRRPISLNYSYLRLSNVEKLILASVMCQDLSNDLDKGIKTKVQYIGSALFDFSPEIILYAVRKYIQIDRLVKHNLDEDPVFMKTLRKVQRLFF